MSEPRFDFVIFGATGFTGQFVVEEVARLMESEAGITMAVAGRNMEKLQTVLQMASKHTGMDLVDTTIIIADVSSEDSLNEMCKQAKVVLNCVGPYRFYGEQIVRACIENGAHHVDISGEPQYLETMQLKYSGKAREAGVYIVGACGFDSVPSDMGILFTKRKFKGDLNSVEFYIALNPGSGHLGGNVTTLESALHGFAHADELKSVRRSLYPSPLPRSKYKVPVKAVGYHESVNKWCLSFPGSDRAIANRSIHYNYDVHQQRPFQTAAYVKLPNFFTMMMFIIFGFFLGLLAKFSCGRALILKYPSVFTAGIFQKGGPSKQQIEQSSFSITLIGKGWGERLEDPDTPHEGPPNRQIITKVSGPEAGYVTTPICMVQCGLTLLKEKDKIPENGGVYTTASVFQDTTLIERLNKHNVIFQEVSQGDL